MAEYSQSFRNYLEDLTHQPGARAPATLGEIWDSEWKRGGLDTITGVGKPLDDAYADLVTAIETASGKTIGAYAVEKGVQLGGMRPVDQRIALLNNLADTLPEETKKDITPLRDVRKRSMQAAQKIERDAADVSSATYGMAGTATAWAAGIARQTSDPVNLALMAATAPIGGPITGPAVKFIAGQAVAGAAAQAVVEPSIEYQREELGLESGFGRAMTNIFEAGVGGAVLGGAFLGTHRLFRAAASTYRGAQPVEAPLQPGAGALASESPIAPARHPELVAEDFEAAALHAERDAVVDVQRTPGVDPIAHAEGVSQARRALEEGRPPNAEPIPNWASEAADMLRDSGIPLARAGQPELPLAKPIEPKGPPAELKEPVEIVGDPALAREVETRLAALGDEAPMFHVEQPDKTLKSGSAKSLLREIEDDAKAVKELVDCIGKEPA